MFERCQTEVCYFNNNCKNINIADQQQMSVNPKQSPTLLPACINTSNNFRITIARDETWLEYTENERFVTREKWLSSRRQWLWCPQEVAETSSCFMTVG